MKIGYARISKADGSQQLDLQIDALKEAGVSESNIYSDQVSGKNDNRPGLDSCLKALRKNDTLIVWKLDRLGRNLKHLVNTVHSLSENKIGFKVLSGQGADIDTGTPSGKLVFGIFASLAEFERELIKERTMVGLKAARARGKKGGRKFQLSKHQVRLAQTAMKEKSTNVAELCRELKISRQTLYRYISPEGNLRGYGIKILERN
ncbi:recombinase family protein [Marinicella gelatinilytica]|uniref:recombinase family protein n=1 Tax=Marinicella gelatinilytica TaxID=2996017 RepID=UPI002260882A|nr:recombinase family protein [Marinicella gelatinilytica]MCX7546254.1 recombinase family protein [Marinicella gelatinilytica]